MYLKSSSISDLKNLHTPFRCFGVEARIDDWGFCVSMNKPIIYTKEDEILLKKYNCQRRASYANQRFDDCITKYDVLSAIKRFNVKCGYCSKSLKASKWQLDHFYPRATGGKNTHENLVPTCKWCNTMKNALDGHSFINFCRTIVSNNQLEMLFYENKIKELHPEFYKEIEHIQLELRSLLKKTYKLNPENHNNDNLRNIYIKVNRIHEYITIINNT